MGVKPMDIEEKEDEVEERSEHKLHWLMAAVFILGDLVGAGMIGLPGAMNNTGLVPGIVLILVCALVSVNNGLQLGWSWMAMQRRWPEKYLHKECRKPYGEIAYRAFGPKMRSFSSFMMMLAQFGFVIVLLLLAAKNLSILLNLFFSIKINFCFLIIIVGLLIWPITMLKSPAHFWQIAVFSALSSTIAVVLILIGMFHDHDDCSVDVAHNSFSIQKFFMGYGTLAFAFGGHGPFPTIQHDMDRPRMFSYSVSISFPVATIYYMAISIAGYFVYGNSVDDAVIGSIQLKWIQHTVNLMVAIHVLSTIVIAFIPVLLHVEHIFRISPNFGVGRVLVRSILYWMVVFVALSLPSFGPVMDLIGASTFSLICFIMPSIFYLFISASETKLQKSPSDQNDVRATIKDVIHLTPKPTLILNILSISFGVIGMVIATVCSIIHLTSSEMAAPCYIQYFREGLPFTAANEGAVNCCGMYRNTTVGGVSPINYCSMTM